MAPFDGCPTAALATGSEFLNFQNTDSIIVEESKPIVRLTAGFRQQVRCHRACNQLKIPSIKLRSFSLGIEILWLANGCENIGVIMVEYRALAKVQRLEIPLLAFKLGDFLPSGACAPSIAAQAALLASGSCVCSLWTLRGQLCAASRVACTALKLRGQLCWR
ncbi:hypothetical protein PIB30_093700 [Stylosanthes scabra]|uniref:Uncharacterized protein n=1 Tax=Stylosanthes scabra TaxID=79078 RepID=A0ABU6QVU8_9FABA|nr:hypothetical protein [Stylosanthes scabra]